MLAYRGGKVMFKFEAGQELIINIKPKRINDSKGVVTKRIKVEEVYNKFILCEGELYKECFLLSSFKNGEITVVREIKKKKEHKTESLKLGVLPLNIKADPIAIE